MISTRMMAGLLLAAWPVAARAETQTKAPAIHEFVVDLSDEAPYFSPKRLRVPANSTVVWKNHGPGLTHTIFMMGDEGPIRSGPLPPSQSWSHTFKGSSVIKTSCEVHPYMYGIVVVGEPSEQQLAAVTASVEVAGQTESAKILEFTMPIAHSVPGILAVDAQDNVWVTLGGGGWANINFPALGKFARLNIDGDISVFSTPAADSGPSGLLLDGSGNLLITELMAGKIGRFSPAKKDLEEFAIPTTPAWPTGLALDREGTLWFNETKGNKVGRLRRDGTMDELPVPTDNAHPTGMVMDATGTVWIAERDAGKVARVSRDGSFVEYGLPTAAAKPAGMTVDSKNNVWFAEREGNKLAVLRHGVVEEFALPNPHSAPFFVLPDRDDNIWFSEVYGNRIGVLLAGTKEVVEFGVPTSDSWPGGLAFDSQDNLWFTEQLSNKVGVLLGAPKALAEALQRRKSGVPTPHLHH